MVDGHDIYDKRTNLVSLRQQVGMVFQKPNPFPKTIFDNVAYGPRLQGVRRKGQLQHIVEQSLKAAAIWDEVKDDLRKSALALSGGQQQRLCIARALATRPRVLLMDEPCSALDPTSTRRIEDTIAELRDEVTVIIVTHDRYFLDNVTKWILELDNTKGIPFEGNYTSWLEQKLGILARSEKKESDRRKSLDRELRWIHMSAEDRDALSHSRVNKTLARLISRLRC